MSKNISVVLKDNEGDGEGKLNILVGDHFLLIRPEGYGDHCSVDGDGYPIGIEFNNGKPRVLIWGDINKEDTTQVIELEGAKETVRHIEVLYHKKKQ